MSKLFFAFLLFLLSVVCISCSDIEQQRKGKCVTQISKLNTKKINTFLSSRNQAKQFDEFFNDLFQQQIFSGVVLVSKKGTVIYKKAYGLANRKLHTELTDDYVFQIGSASKQFTSVAILILIQQGKISLDDSIQKFFPLFPYKNIFIRTLLTHRSGLPNYMYFCDNLVSDKFKLLTNKDVVNIMCNNFPEKYYKSDKGYHYCNTNYALLAAIVEEVSGLSFEQFVHNNIFNKIGMNHSFFYSEIENYNNLNIATGYLSPKYEAGFFYLNGVTGDKGIFTTVDDLYKWDLALYSDSLVNKEILQQAFQPQTKTRRSNIYYGFGWKMYFLEDSTQVLFHSGWWQGFQSVIMRLPKDSSSVIIIKNKKTAHPVDQRKMIDILYPGNKLFGLRPVEIKESTETIDN
ncbi:MAG: serine hydrolase [Bacteroidia bacterium]|nr:serine hydrolase [Bacteroidia bacterium]